MFSNQRIQGHVLDNDLFLKYVNVSHSFFIILICRIFYVRGKVQKGEYDMFLEALHIDIKG